MFLQLNKNMKRSPQQRANLRCCASCEWIYRGLVDCPKCGFASYGAKYVHGNKCYKYEVTQQPWIERKVARFTYELMTEVRETSPATQEHVRKQMIRGHSLSLND